MPAGLAEVAQRLREVREAHHRFLALYAVEVALVEPGIDRVAADVMGESDRDDEPDVQHWRADGGGGDDDSAPLDWQ